MKKTSETVEDIMKTQLSILETNDKLSKLEKESIRDKKIIQELKEREKVSARALVLFERKVKFLKETIISQLLHLCKSSDESKELLNNENYEELNQFLNDSNQTLYELCNKVEEISSISASDKAFILNKPIENNEKQDANSRFDRLKANFEQKIGSSVLRKPGRPKKQDQSIVADIGLGKKVEKVIDEQTETKTRLNEIFYGTPTQKTTVSTIPQTADAMFDFAEALNPNHSLQDIMSDIMADLSNDNPIKYSKENIDNFITKKSEDELKMLEAGYLSKPNKHETFELDDEFEVEKKEKKVYKNGILTNNHLFDEIKK